MKWIRKTKAKNNMKHFIELSIDLFECSYCNLAFKTPEECVKHEKIKHESTAQE